MSVLNAAESIDEPLEVVEEATEESPITLKITQSGIKSEFLDESGNRTYKNISIASLAKILNKDTEFDTGILPIVGRNYIGIRRYIKTGDRDILFIESSPGPRNVDFSHGRNSDTEDETFEQVPFPGLLAAVICVPSSSSSNSYTLKRSMLFALRRPLSLESDSLYRFPYGNIYSDNRICWGSVNLNSYTTLKQFGSLLDLFLSSTMNKDLYPGSGELSSKLSGLAGSSDPYPTESLEVTDFNFRELINFCKSKNI